MKKETKAEMKTKEEIRTREEILKTEFGIKPYTKFHEYEYLYRSILMAMEIYASQFRVSGATEQEAFPDTEADGIVFCGKCGKRKE